jgi:membrane-associated phospholipid phosphatase
MGVRAQDTMLDAAWIESAKADLREFPDWLKQDAKATFFNSDNAAALLWAGLASVAMNNGDADDDIAEYFETHDTFGKTGAEAFNILGSPLTHFPAAALWYAVSANRQDEVNKQRAMTMFTALTINGTATVALKAVRQNDRPAGDGWAWPSGHTSSSFTVASVLHEFYGLKVGIPAYAVAGLVAYRMMDVGDHWASDVVFGATLGLVVGHSVARNHRAPQIAGFDVLPYYGNQEHPALGVNLAHRF